MSADLKPCWVQCPDCDDFWCEEHQEHAADCDCPAIDEWVEQGAWPYVENDMTQYEKAGLNELSLFLFGMDMTKEEMSLSDIKRGDIVWIDTQGSITNGKYVEPINPIALKRWELSKDLDGYYLWSGGDCPVPGDWVVEIKHRNKIGCYGVDSADSWCWGGVDASSEIEAFKPISRPDMPSRVEPMTADNQKIGRDPGWNDEIDPGEPTLQSATRSGERATVSPIYPADDFKVVCDSAAKEVEFGIILGWEKETGEFVCYGGGTDDGRRPVARDWLWLVERFKNNLMNGDYDH